MDKILEKQSGVFVAGAILTIFWSIVVGALHVGVFYLLGIPLFGLLLGIILVWTARAAAERKILFTVLPLPIVLSVFFLLSEINKAEPEVFLIPKDLRGEIVVFYDEPCGLPPVYENGRRIYQIPDSGVLITAFKENTGHLDQKFYFIDEFADKTAMPRFHWQSYESERNNWHYMHSTAVADFTKDTVGAFWSYGSETHRLSKNSSSYIISNFRRFEKDPKEAWLETKQFTDTSKKLLEECRQNL